MEYRENSVIIMKPPPGHCWKHLRPPVYYMELLDHPESTWRVLNNSRKS
jgi:hypothetical protein